MFLKKNKKKIVLFIALPILFLFCFVNFGFSATFPNEQKKVLRALIKRALEEVEKALAGYMVINESGIAVVDYEGLYELTKDIIEDENKLNFEPYLTKELIVGIHYRENNNNINSNPLNGDGVFQLYKAEEKIKNNPQIYCTKPEDYEKIYKSCFSKEECEDFTINLAYQYCDFIQYVKHKFKYINIAKEAIYGRKWRGTYIKGLYQILKEKDIHIDKKLFDLFLESLKANNIKIVDYTKTNFFFVENDLGINNFNDFIDYLYEQYFKDIGYEKEFVRVLFEIFQDAVIYTYYNGLGGTYGSRVTKSYVINIPGTFASVLCTKPLIKEKDSGAGYYTKDKQVGALIRYFYTSKPKHLKYLLLFIDNFVR